jgi:heme exporter protein C
MDRMGRVMWFLGGLAAVAVATALYAALIVTPSERVMGEAVRILYVHVGAAWTAYLAYVVTALAAVTFLRRRAATWDHLALASAEWGLVLTTLTLLTGMLWGRVTQGWWWRWDDPRLTLTLMLWFLYAAYLILRQYTEGERRAAVSAVLAVAGVPAMVLNHFAVLLFPAYHPAPVAARAGGPGLAPPFIAALVLSVVAYTLVYLTLLVARMRLETRRDALAARSCGR